MTCMEVADMMVYEFTKRVIVPVVAAIFLAALFYPLCVENSVCDYLKLWVLMGSVWRTPDVCVGNPERV